MIRLNAIVWSIWGALLALSACQPPSNSKLPILGERIVENGDTIFHTVPEFSFTDQTGAEVTNKSFENKAYVVDFFFISCPTICPVVKKQMLRVYDHFSNEDRLMFLSHTIDPKRDTVEALKTYANNLDVKADRWKFVTGQKDDIYDIADDYFSIAIENPDAPGGFDHSGRLILVDPGGRIRSFCNGTDPEDVDRFIQDIETLMLELNQTNI